MSIKGYKDEDGQYLNSDEVLFEENTYDIIDDLYIKDIFYIEPSKLYEEILNDKTCKSKELFKGNYHCKD